MRAAALLLLALAGCERETPPACFVMPLENVKSAVDAKATDWAGTAQLCIAHWAAVLAPSPDSPYSVADATVRACAGPIGLQANALQREYPDLYPAGPALEKRLTSDGRAEALFLVERFRAAGCKPTGNPG